MSKNLIAISGKAGSGKNTVASMLQELNSNFQEKAFAAKLKQVASMLTGIPMHKFEDQEFKKTFLGPEWNQVIKSMPCGCDWILDSYADQEGKCRNCGEPLDIKTTPMTVREFLQKLGTDGLRDGLHTNVWVNALFADYVAEPDKNIAAFLAAEGLPQSMNGGQKEYPNWIITDCRFPNEAQAVKECGGIVIRIEREGLSTMDHPSETSLDDYEFDHIIYNNGSLSELRNKVIEMYESIIV